MAALEVLALDTVTPQIRAPGAADTYTMPRALAVQAPITAGDSAGFASVGINMMTGSGNARFQVNGSDLFGSVGAGIGFCIGNQPLQFGGGVTVPDLHINRDAANTLAQRNGVNAQTSRVYNTFTDSSNYERNSTTWSGNVCYAKNENLGTGSARLYIPVTGATTVAGLPAAATAGAGARCFVTDATATTFLSTVVGGGANKVPVVCDGTLWLIG